MFNMLLIIFLVAGSSAQELYDCNSHKDDTVYYRVGETISLCCTLPGKECSELNDDDVGRIERVSSQRRPPSDDAATDTLVSCPRVTDETLENNDSCDRCSYTFQKDNATLSDGGTYRCYINEESVRVTDVYIIAKPNASEILKLSVSDDYVMTVEFEKGDCHPWVNDLTVFMEYRKKVTQLCRVNCSLCKDICSCEYLSPTRAIPRNPVTLTVNVSSPSVDLPIQNTSSTSAFKLFEHIVPSKVEELKLFSVTVNEAIIMFRPTSAQLRNIYNMRIVSKPLNYKIFLSRTQGLSEVLRVEFQKKVFSVSKYPYQFVAIRFTNLTTFTTYRLSVAGVGGGGEGGSTTLEFTTDKTVPQSPPKVDDFTYSRILGERYTSSLYLWWQPLPQASRGGSSLSYHLMVTSANGISLKETTVCSAYTLFDSLPSHEPLTVKIWAKNELGRSESYSQIYIPAYQDVQPPMYVEYDLDKNMSYVFINMIDIEGVEMLAIHRCDVSQGSLCTTYPYTQIKQVDSSKSFGGGTLMFDMPLATPATLTTVVARREVEYFDTEDGDNPFQNPNGHSACANVTLDVDESEGLWDASTTDTYPMLYLSVQVKGSWLGMVRAKCYFTRKSINVVLEQTAEHDGNKHSLRFIQHCDPGAPVQFLAEHFIVYALMNDSNDGECSGLERHKVGEKNNNIFTVNTIDLPPGMKYACVEAVAFNSSTSYTSKTLKYESVKTVMKLTANKETVTNAVIVITATAAVFAVAASLFCLIKRCKISRERIQRFKERERNDEQHDIELMNPNLTSNLTEQGDSGHGTTGSSYRDETETTDNSSLAERRKLLQSPVESGSSSQDSDNSSLAERRKLLQSPVESGSSSQDSEHVRSGACSDNAQVHETVLTHQFPCSNNYGLSSSSDWSKSTFSRKSKLNNYWKDGDLTFRPPTDDSSGCSTASGGGTYSGSSFDYENSTSGTN
ncbi:unnamed protein product [Lymnaea stagnalis]|uniref:Fibronectin type-III domain-containing protein n=1 Tax=Lymnaea stagnalis TaxID=6523 RepID=A0AAV2IK75_LYMST